MVATPQLPELKSKPSLHAVLLEPDQEGLAAEPQSFKPPATWSALGLGLLLACVVVQGGAEHFHGRMLGWGEAMWPGYAALRTLPPAPPRCDQKGAQGSFEAVEPKAVAAADLLDGLFADEPQDQSAIARAAQKAHAACLAQKRAFVQAQARITPMLRGYLGAEAVLAGLASSLALALPALLVMLLFLAAMRTSLLGEHLALRSAEDLDLYGQRMLRFCTAFINVALAWAFFTLAKQQLETGFGFGEAAGWQSGGPWLSGLWGFGFLALGGVELRAALQITYIRRPVVWRRFAALTGLPLYAGLGAMTLGYFIGVEQHPAGVAIYLQKLTEHAPLYLHVALYVWVGMLLKQTSLAERAFALLRPWGFAPEFLACFIVVGAAWPTAYSGASGIFVMAAGGVIYAELRRAGAGDGLARAATAMAGSLGVVLSPCLLVVIVASLNKGVTTTELFEAGKIVFALTASLFCLTTLLVYRPRWRPQPGAHAWRSTQKAMGRLLPYLVAGGGVLWLYPKLLGTTLDAQTAPLVLPVALLACVGVASAASRKYFRKSSGGDLETSHALETHRGLWKRLEGATSETGVHVGALLLLMALSVGLGGVVERSGLMAVAPQAMSSPVLAMGVLVLALVLVGMMLDPYGAVILVSATLARPAEASGISPIHFWAVVLLAFELGYLTPPVALNHLLVSKVVARQKGEDGMPEVLSIHASHGVRRFLLKRTRLGLPLVVMGTALLLVAFVPLFSGQVF